MEGSSNTFPLSFYSLLKLTVSFILSQHAKKCHGKSTHPGETDIYLKDKVFDLVNSRRADQSAGLGDTSEEEEESDDRDESENEGKRRRRR